MGHYKSNVRDLEFNLFEVFGRRRLLGHGAVRGLDTDTAREMLQGGRPPGENELARASSTPTATPRHTTRRPAR